MSHQPFWDDKAEWEDSFHDASLNAKFKSVAASNRYSSSSSQSGSLIPPPPPSDESDDKDSTSSLNESFHGSNVQGALLAFVPDAASSSSTKEEKSIRIDFPNPRYQNRSIVSDDSFKSKRRTNKSDSIAESSVGEFSNTLKRSISSEPDHNGCSVRSQSTASSKKSHDKLSSRREGACSTPHFITNAMQSKSARPDDELNESYEDGQDILNDLFDLLPVDQSHATPTQVPTNASPNSSSRGSYQQSKNQQMSLHYQRDLSTQLSPDQSRSSSEASPVNHPSPEFISRDPPTDDTSTCCDSEESEIDDQWLFSRRLMSLLGALKMLALRCAFDHWKRAAAFRQQMVTIECRAKSLDIIERVAVKSRLQRVIRTWVSLIASKSQLQKCS
jgi:hypothetical protein